MYKMKKRSQERTKSLECTKVVDDDSLGLDSVEVPNVGNSAVKGKALTAILRKLAYEDFSALEKFTLNDEDTCNCHSCEERRSWTNEILKELKLIHSYWLELRQYLKIIYKLSLRGSVTSVDTDYHDYMKDLVSRLFKVCDPHQLFKQLEGQVREFVMEIKMRLLQLMDNLADSPQLPHLFISGMLERYNKMMSAANDITPVLKQLENEHLKQFNLTWKMLNQRLFQTSICTDPFFQDSVPLFITQLGKNNDTEENKLLVREFISFDDEISLVEGMWKDIESRLNQYALEQTNLGQQKFLKDEYWNDLKAHRKIHLKNCNNNKMLKLGRVISDNFLENSEIDSEISIESTDACECNVCLDSPVHSPVTLVKDIMSTNLHGGGFHLYPHIHGTGGDFNDDFAEALTLDTCLEMDGQNGFSLLKPRVLPHLKTASEEVSSEFPVQKRVDKATQKDQEVPVSEDKNITLGTGVNSVDKVSKETGKETLHPPHHSCFKHSDTIKRISCPDQEEEILYNNHEDSHSEGSQPDPRHCDCCYCEVFGHGIPTSAPMSKNYQEMRERLRLLLNKKKSKCKSNSGSPQPISQTAKKKQPCQIENGGDMKTQDTRNLEDLLVYIEGTKVKSRNEKRAAKKARQREKKQILLDQQKREEEERSRKIQETLEAKQKEEEKLRATKEEKELHMKLKKKGKGKIISTNAQLETTPKNISQQSKRTGPQMVTIKRVMEPHNSEPTVTITLRGATPNQDKVLYTLLNGQVCKVKDTTPIKSGISKAVKQNTPASKLNNKGEIFEGDQNIKFSSPFFSINQNIKKRDPKSPDCISLSKIPILNERPPEIQISKPVNNSGNKISKPFNIEDIRLPPGITITKVDPAKVQMKNMIQERQQNKFQSQQSLKSPPSSEVIVVSTGKLKEASQFLQGKEKSTHLSISTNNGKKKKAQKRGEEDDFSATPLTNGTSSTLSNKKKKNKKKVDRGDILNGKTSIYPGIDIEPIDLQLKSNIPQPSFAVGSSKLTEQMTKKHLPHLQAEVGKKKKKRNKKALSNSEELSLLDSVFAPKDIDLDDGEMDDAERELEAFKRFCFQSVPPKQKEKVHLNLKDIVLKKKSSVISCS